VENDPFYKPIYAEVLARIKAGKPIKQFYDDRGDNIVKQLMRFVGDISFEQALDIGCGLGQLSFSLSAKCKNVVAADISRDAIKIVAIDAKNKKLPIHCVLMDARYLPFKPNSFDLIVSNGVLEWTPVNDDSSKFPSKVQRDVLRGVQRILNRSGVYWLGIENRYASDYFIGITDHHSGLRFVTFLPRFMANFYSKLVKKQPYKTYLYNYWELRKLLLSTGLCSKKFLVAFPFYANPKHAADMSNPGEIAKAATFYATEFSRSLTFSLARTALIKAISLLRLGKIFSNSFIVLCTRTDASDSNTTFLGRAVRK
jgi:2-polyprenyl-3-methyl-5-hydroxy-6-metoxy-1,4-benzoquinol methylase